MALNSASYFNNAIVGTMQVGADINILEINASPKFPIGQGFTRSDGNKYRYAYIGTATNAGSLVAPIFASSGKATTDNIVIASASAVVVEAQRPILPGQPGSNYVQLTLASITAGQFKGSYFITEDGSGRGYTYRVRGNTATGDPASGDIRLQLWEPLKTQLSPNTDITIVPCMYNDLKTATVATDWAVAGVVCSTTTAASPFGWICTHGVISTLQDGTVTGGDQVALSRATAGAVSVYGQGDTNVAALVGEQIVGYCVQTGATTEFASIYLQIE